MRLALLRAAEDSAFGAQFSAMSSASIRLGAPDSTRPTLAGVAPGTPAPRLRRSRAWFALILVPALLLAGFVGFRRATSHDAAAPGSASASLGAATSSAASAGSIAEPELPRVTPSATETANETSAGSVANKRIPNGTGKRARSGEAAARPAAPTDGTPSDPSPPVESEPIRVAPIALESPSAAPPASPPSAEKSLVSPPIQAAPAAPTANPALASVSIGGARNAIGATALSVARAVSAAAPRITACYKAALPSLGSAFEGVDTLHVETDGGGVITEARLSGPVRGNLAACVAGAVQGRRVANVDTGSASADVALSFRDH